MRIIVKGGFTAGKSTTAIMKEIQHKYNIEKNHAKFIARDQIGKLNATVIYSRSILAGKIGVYLDIKISWPRNFSRISSCIHNDELINREGVGILTVREGKILVGDRTDGN